MKPLAAIIDEVAEFYGVRADEIRSERRDAKTAWARHVVMWLARELTPYSLPRIGTLVGGRDHTTVMHGLKRVDADREALPSVRTETDALFHKISGSLAVDEPLDQHALSLARWLLGKPASARAANGEQLGIICRELLRLAEVQQFPSNTEKNDD